MYWVVEEFPSFPIQVAAYVVDLISIEGGTGKPLLTLLMIFISIDTAQNGSFKVFNEIMKDHKKGGFGTLSIQETFEKSSNIGIAKLIQNHFGKIAQMRLEGPIFGKLDSFTGNSWA